MLVRSLGQEDLEEGMATHSSILSWRTSVFQNNSLRYYIVFCFAVVE